MHQKRRKFRWLLLLCCGMLLMLAACVEDISVIPSDGARKVVVSCVLHNTEVQKLQLSYSKTMDDDAFSEEVEAATATLYEADKAVGQFEKVSYGEWELKYTPVLGKTYRLVVNVPGEKEISATTTMPIPVRIVRGEPRNRNRTKPFLQRNHTAPFWMFALSSSLKDPRYYIEHPRVEDDKKARLMRIIATTHQDADHFTQDDVVDQYNTFNDGSIPYKQYIRVAPNPNITPQHPYEFTVAENAGEYSFIVMRSASPEYDRYLKSILEKLVFYESEDDPARWFDETVIYTNITNGVGIFAAYWQQSFYYNNIMFRVTPPTPIVP